jgi:hypothetical protein
MLLDPEALYAPQEGQPAVVIALAERDAELEPLGAHGGRA